MMAEAFELKISRLRCGCFKSSTFLFSVSSWVLKSLTSEWLEWWDAFSFSWLSLAGILIGCLIPQVFHDYFMIDPLCSHSTFNFLGFSSVAAIWPSRCLMDWQALALRSFAESWLKSSRPIFSFLATSFSLSPAKASLLLAAKSTV